jgi:hypothetical protein
VFINEGTGTFVFGQELTTLAFNSHSLHSVDIDNDGDIDILTNYDQTSAVIWFANNGEGTFSAENTVYSQTDYIGLQSVYCADLDQDGDVEVIWAAVNHGLFYHDNMSLVSSLDETELNPENYFNAFPNPANAHLNLSLSPAAMALQKPSMLIFNMNGQWMMEELILDQNKAVYDLSHLSAGQYLIELHAAGVMLQRELLVVE